MEIDYYCAILGYTLAQLSEKDKQPRKAAARWVIWDYIRSKKTNITITQLAAIFNRDHSTALHGLKQINEIKKYRKHDVVIDLSNLFYSTVNEVECNEPFIYDSLIK